MSKGLKERRASALRSYDEYFRLCIARPELSTFSMAETHLKLPAASELWDAHDKGAASYVWFVSYALKVFDDLLEYDSFDDWQDAVLFQLSFHETCLATIWPDYWAGVYGAKLANLVEKVIGKGSYA